MIELQDVNGKFMVYRKDIKRIGEFFDERYPNEKCRVHFYDGHKETVWNSYEDVKNKLTQTIELKIHTVKKNQLLTT